MEEGSALLQLTFQRINSSRSDVNSNLLGGSYDTSCGIIRRAAPGRAVWRFPCAGAPRAYNGVPVHGVANVTLGSTPCAHVPAPPGPTTSRRMDVEASARKAHQAKDRKQTLSILMTNYGDALFRYCKLLLPPHLAADVHQQIFVEAYRDLPGFEGRSSFRTWLYSIARHRCLDALKAERRWWGRMSPEGLPPDAEDPRPSPLELLDRQELVEALESCLRGLNPNVQIAVALRYVEGFSYTEMSKVCGELPGTLQQRVARALPVLRQCVEAKVGEET